MFAGIFFFFRFKDGHEFHQKYPPQTLMNLQYMYIGNAVLAIIKHAYKKWNNLNNHWLKTLVFVALLFMINTLLYSK